MKRLFLFAMVFSLLCGNVTALGEKLPYRVRHGDRSVKQVAITIDDCFSIEYTRAAYELSMQYNVPITFFVMGNVLKPSDAELWRAIAASHNEIGNHTKGHLNLHDRSRQHIYSQIMQVQSTLDATLGYHYPLQVFRPPFGHLDPEGTHRIKSMLKNLGYDHAILWDVSDIHFESCYKSVKNGSILLFHTNKKDINCIAQLIPRLLEDGYELVTISDMLGLEPVATSTDLYEYVTYGDWAEAFNANKENK